LVEPAPENASNENKRNLAKSKSTGEQIAFALRQAEVGMPVAEVCRKIGVSEATY
jgi:putative transposase